MKYFSALILFFLIISCNKPKINEFQKFSWISEIDSIVSFSNSDFKYKNFELFDVIYPKSSISIDNYNYLCLEFFNFYYYDSTIFAIDCEFNKIDTFVCFKSYKNEEKSKYLIKKYWSDKQNDTIFHLQLISNRDLGLKKKIIFVIGLKCGIIGIYNLNLSDSIVSDIYGTIYK
jgi:hypothetical protein